MITIEQIKAARGLLDWNQEVLAEHSGISKAAINNLERRVVTPRIETLNALQRAFEGAGVEFVDGPGVRLRGGLLKVHTFEGQDAIHRLWNDTFDTLGKGDERLISGVKESEFTSAADEERFNTTMQKYMKRNIRGRILSLHGDTNFADPSSEYRWVSKEEFSQVPTFVYANKYAIVIWKPVQRVLLIENEAIAESFRKHFNVLWKNAKIPPAYVYKRPEQPKE